MKQAILLRVLGFAGISTLIVICAMQALLLIQGKYLMKLAWCSAQVPTETWMRGHITRYYPNVNPECDQLWNGSKLEIQRIKTYLSTWRIDVASYSSITFATYLEFITTNCAFVQHEFMNNFYVSKEELDFPIAFLISISEKSANIHQYIRFLKSVFRFHNAYCIHIDKKSSTAFREAFLHISKCLSNVIISEKAEDVLYGSIDILLAQLHCYNSLRNFTLVAWKYAINLCGTELPLYTNRQMVQALQEMQAFSVIPHGQSQSEVESWVANQFIFKITRGANRAKLNLKEQLGISPITPMYKASVYMALTKRFVEFILDDMEVNTFRNFLVNAMSPEEFFYATINQMTRAPDNYASAPESQEYNTETSIRFFVILGTSDYLLC